MDNHLIITFVNNINSLSSNNINEKLSLIYTQEVEFIDPVKGINGLAELTGYFKNLYKSVDHCHFTISNHLKKNDHYAIQWQMNLKHKKLAKNNEIIVDGASFLRFKNEKVCYHRDYYDLGALIYEQIPILGSAIRTVRNAF